MILFKDTKFPIIKIKSKSNLEMCPYQLDTTIQWHHNANIQPIGIQGWIYNTANVRKQWDQIQRYSVKRQEMRWGRVICW